MSRTTFFWFATGTRHFDPNDQRGHYFLNPLKFHDDFFILADFVQFFELFGSFSDIISLRAVDFSHKENDWPTLDTGRCIYYHCFWIYKLPFTGHFFATFSTLGFLCICPTIFLSGIVLVLHRKCARAMGGDRVPVEPDKCDDWKVGGTVWHIYKEGGISQYMEFMTSHDEGLSRQFVTSWKDRRVTIGSISFDINEEVIARATSLTLDGRTWKKTTKVVD